MHNTTTDTQYVGWYPSPDKRGTFNILQTCLSALFFCAYTALHLDVPWVKERRLSKTLHLAKWMAISIFFPEFLLFAAATQMLCATSVQRTVNKLYRKLPTKFHLEKPQWRLQHSYFSLTGGYQLVHTSVASKADIEDLTVSKAASKSLALRLSPDCLIDMFFNTSFSLISSGELQDRSKASNLSKILAASQTTYLVIQVIGRLLSALPVTELEVNTIAHIFCAVIAWALWFRKPYNVDNPQTIQLTSDLGGRIACRWMLQSKGSVDQLLDLLDLSTDQIATNDEIERFEVEDGPFLPNTFASAVKNLREALSSIVVVDGQGIQINAYSSSRDLNQNTKFVALVNRKPSPQQCLDLADKVQRDIGVAIPCILMVSNSAIDVDNKPTDYESPRYTYVSLENVENSPSVFRTIEGNEWEYAIQHRFWTEPELRKIVLDLERMILRTNATCLNTVIEENTMIVDSMLQDEDLPIGDGFLWCVFLLAIVLTSYGALHAALWNAKFPTPRESWLWRVSSLLICATPTITFIILAFETVMDFNIHVYWYWAFSVLAWAGQIFLVVEAFISLRSQPIGVYEQVSWARYIPHL